MNARALRRGVAQLGDPPVHGFRHAAQLVRVGLALLPQPAVRQPLVEGLRLKHHGSNCFVAVLGGVVLQFLALASGRPRPVQDAAAG